MRELLIYSFLFFQIEEEFLKEYLGSSCKISYPNPAATPLQPNFIGPLHSHSHIIFVHILFSTLQTFVVASLVRGHSDATNR